MCKLIFSSIISSLLIGFCFFLFYIMVQFDFGWALFAFIVAFVVSFVMNCMVSIPITLILKNFNHLHWLSIALSGFAVAFIIYFVLMITIDSGVISIISLLIASSVSGIVGLFASALFYKSLLLIEKREIKKAQ